MSDLDDLSMFELFQVEAEGQLSILTSGLLSIERTAASAEQLEGLMRAAHSLKGAASIIGLRPGVLVAHAMEDTFVAAQERRLNLGRREVDLLLTGVDLLTRISRDPEADVDVDAFICALRALTEQMDAAPVLPQQGEPLPVSMAPSPENSQGVLRVTAGNLNRLLGLAGEVLVEARWPGPFSDNLLRMKRTHRQLGHCLEALRDSIGPKNLSEKSASHLADALRTVSDCERLLAQRLTEIDQFDRRSTSLSHRLYREVLDCRMRPFADGIQVFPRIMRDLGRSLGKEVRLEIEGESTEVDREVLERLEAPLTHLLRNAVDHGIESPDERLAGGKPAEGVVRLEARHASGMLLISVSDDGRGVNMERLREAVLDRNLTTPEVVSKLSDSELLEFLALPGFTMKESVTEISGRGVGLDAVQAAVKAIRGTLRITTEPGAGARFQMQLPLTLSVMRTLLVEIGGEPYAFPLANIHRTLRLEQGQIDWLEGRQHFAFEGARVGLVPAHQILECSEPPAAEQVSVVVLGSRTQHYGLVVDRFLGEEELVIQPLDPRLGRIKDVSAAAILANGAPALVLDVQDVIQSVEKLVNSGRLGTIRGQKSDGAGRKTKRVLVVDDSLTVRELERKLLAQRGYEVVTAVDGIDGWNSARSSDFDLVITDVDMPRMDGIELVTLIRKDTRLKSIPTMIVSYKDRAEDRRRGLEAGADYYLAKSSFHDETLLEAVVDLIGAAHE